MQATFCLPVVLLVVLSLPPWKQRTVRPKDKNRFIKGIAQWHHQGKHKLKKQRKRKKEKKKRTK